MIATPARGRHQVRAQMRGKGLQDWMRPALSLHGLGQMWKRRIPAAHVSKGDIKGTKGTRGSRQAREGAGAAGKGNDSGEPELRGWGQKG